jgi:outer membrane receptor for Fe3+-dicitrate
MAGDGETEYLPAEEAEHWVAGLQHDFDNGVHLRIEGYYKKYSDLRPDFRSSFDDIEMFPELEYDRTVVYRADSRSRGLELYLKRDTRGKLSWWASYALAKFEDDVYAIEFRPEDVTVAYDRNLPTPNDQRHTLYFDLSYRPSHKWQFNLALQFHTGWPYTGVHTVEVPISGGDTYVYLQAEEQLSSRHGSYKRVDLRVNRYFRVGKGRITAFVELINVFGFDNVRSYIYEILPGGPKGYYLEAEAENWFGRLPSFGVAYEVNL